MIRAGIVTHDVVYKRLHVRLFVGKNPDSESVLLSDGKYYIAYDSATEAARIGFEIKRRFASRLAMAMWELS